MRVGVESQCALVVAVEVISVADVTVVDVAISGTVWENIAGQQISLAGLHQAHIQCRCRSDMG